MKHNEENGNSPEKASEQLFKNNEKDLQQPTRRRLRHEEALAEMNKDLGIVNPNTNLEKSLEMEDRDGSSISISFINRRE